MKVILLVVFFILMGANLIFSEAKSHDPRSELSNSLGLKMTKVYGRTFKMNTTNSGEESTRVESSIILNGAFWISTTEVTRGQWRVLFGPAKDSDTHDDKLPIVNVSYFEALKFCELLTAREQNRGLIGKNSRYQLPTEAQWDYACRMGEDGDFHCERNELNDYEVFDPEIDGEISPKLQPVSSKKPNKYGLYDMQGNAMEWCLDSFKDLPASGENPVNLGVSDIRAPKVTVRGGSAGAPARAAGSRNGFHPMMKANWVGFRVVLNRD